MAMIEWAVHRNTAKRQMRVILCDDDRGFLGVLRDALHGTFAKLSVNAAISAFGSPEDIQTEQLALCDMAFLDIDYEKGDRNGIEIARQLREVNSRALIFFVTNFIDYAPAGYEVQAFRYVLKRDMKDVLDRYIMQAMEQLAEGQECLRLQIRDEIVDIPLERISYLEVMDHSVSIHTGEDSYELSASLSSLEERLQSCGFLRIHKSYLVNMRHIRKFRSRECLLADGTVIAVSERNYAQQKQKYLLWKGLK